MTDAYQRGQQRALARQGKPDPDETEHDDEPTDAYARGVARAKRLFAHNRATNES